MHRSHNGIYCCSNSGFDFVDFFNDSDVDFGIAIVCLIDDFLPKKNHMEINPTQVDIFGEHFRNDKKQRRG